MKAKTSKPGLVSLKRGDRVALYRTEYYKRPIFTNTKLNNTWSYALGGAITNFYDYAFVLRVYKHIGACVVKFDAWTSRSTLFIKENDPQWAVYIEEVEG